MPSTRSAKSAAHAKIQEAFARGDSDAEGDNGAHDTFDGESDEERCSVANGSEFLCALN